jgi:hypothetical protein
MVVKAPSARTHARNCYTVFDARFAFRYAIVASSEGTRMVEGYTGNLVS